MIQLARERGLRRFYSLRKAELLQRLRASGSTVTDRENDARMVNVPILRPTPYTAPQPTPTPTPSPSSNAVEELIDYLENVREILRSVFPKLQRLKDKINRIFEERKLFEVKESDSALKKFVKIYTIDGKLGFDARSF